MDYQSTIHVQSKTCPDVSFTLHKPSYGRVIEFDRKNAKFFEESRKLNQESIELQEELDASRKAWFEGQASKLASLKAAEVVEIDSVARIETGLEHERLLGLIPRANTDEQRQELADKLVAVPQDREVFKMDAELLGKIRDLRRRSEEQTYAEYNPARVRWGLAGVDGLTINGKSATVETLLADGPSDLVREIVSEIDAMTSMTPEQLRNFNSPSSSENQAGKAETTITAIAA